MKVELDGCMMTDRKAAHDYLAEMLRLPSWYGRNLDALYDLLTGQGTPLEIVISHAEDMKNHLGVYGSTLLHTLQEAENDNINLTVTIA